MSYDKKNTQRLPSRRPGLTLVELLIASTIMAMLVGGLAVMAQTASESAVVNQESGTVAQHARVLVERIRRHVEQAHANGVFPGALVLPETVGSWDFPETLVVWHPAGAPADPEGLPKVNELIFYTPNPEAPNEFWEAASESDTSIAPAVDDVSGWHALVQAVLSGSQTRKTVLTDMMRMATIPEASPVQSRGCVRFGIRLRPSAEEMSSYHNGTLAWGNLSWAQSIFGATAGLRQTWVHFELQLISQPDSGTADPDSAVPIFGSAALYYQLSQ